MCLNGQAMCVPTNKVQENLDQGATLGSCDTPPCASSGQSLVALPPAIIVNGVPVASKMDFTLYPNPTWHQVNVELEDFIGLPVQLILYNQLGQIVRIIRIDEVQMPTQRIDVDRLATAPI